MTIMSDALLLSKLPINATLIANYETGSELVEFQFFYTSPGHEKLLLCVERNGKMEEVAFEQIVIPPSLIAKITEAPAKVAAKEQIKKIRQEKINMSLSKIEERVKLRQEIEAKTAATKAKRAAMAEERRREREELKELSAQANRLAREEKKDRQIYLNKIKKAINAIDKAEETGSVKMLESALKLVDSLKAA